MKEREKIIRFPHLIVCEGLDAKLFMIYYLESLIKKDKRFDQYQVIDSGGVRELRLFLRTLPKLSGFDAVRSLVILRDAESSAQGAHQSVMDLLREECYAVPESACKIALPGNVHHQIKIGYAFFPSLNAHNENGTLEDLCLNILSDSNSGTVLGFVDSVIQARQDVVTVFKRPHKNKLHTYLSLTDEFVGLKIGESARANAFDFTARVFESFRVMLLKMLD